MKNKTDIRWEQRFQNYSKAFNYLENALNIKKPDVTQQAGIIQFFEMSFELSWKVMKDYLEEKGFVDVKSPRDAIKKAFEIEIITEGESWLKALVDRNLTSHTYEEKTAKQIEELIRNEYFYLLKDFKTTMENKLQ